MSARAPLSLSLSLSLWLALAACGGAAADPAPGPAAAGVLSLDEAMRALGEKLAPAEGSAVAVFAFNERGLGPTLLGEYVGDKLMVALGTVSKAQLVERGRLEAVRREQNLGVSGEIDDATAASVGNLAGASAVVVGVLTRVGEQYEANARLLGAGDAAVRSLGEVRFTAAGLPEGMAGVALGPEGLGGGAGAVSGGAAGAGASPAKAFFFEDFSRVAEGELPAGWVGGDKMMVAKEGRGSFLYVNGDDSVTTPAVQFPPNFRLEVVITQPNSCFGSYLLELGGVKAGLYGASCGTMVLGGQGVQSGKAIGTRVAVVFERKGDVLSLTAGGERLLVERKPGFDPGDRIKLSMWADKNQVRIHSIAGIATE